jgi:hypothetical protein
MISAGTVAVTHSYEFATFTAAPFPAFGTLDGWFFRTSGSPDISRVVDQVGNVVEFDQVYSGPTSSATTYELLHLEYALVSDTLRLIHPMRTFFSGERYEVLGIDMSAMDRDWPLSRVVAGLPSHYAHVSELLVRFNRSGPTDDEDLFRVEYDYLIRPDDLVDSPTQEPVVPRQWRRVLSDWASFWILMDKNDDRADAVVRPPYSRRAISRWKTAPSRRSPARRSTRRPRSGAAGPSEPATTGGPRPQASGLSSSRRLQAALGSARTLRAPEPMRPH